MIPTYAMRKASLRALRQGLIDHEERLLEALRLDLGKSTFEAYTNELGVLHVELGHALRHLRRWMKPRRFLPELYLWPALGEVRPEPLGRALIIGPFNYPIMLALGPLISALAAGCTVVLKPSELARHSEAALRDLVTSLFDPAQVAIETGGPDVAARLLAQPFDKIFFTGSPAVGKLVLRAAAENLTSVTLELGGKSPALVDATVDLKMAARKVAWGKFNNAGQTCVAPDYVLVHESVRDAFVEGLKAAITEFYGDDPKTSPNFGRIISDRHFARIAGYLNHGQVVVGGQTDASTRYVAPTVVFPASWDDPSMTDEIFGPVLPVLTFRTPLEAAELVGRRPKPLALYIFSEHKPTQVLWRDLAFGGGGVHATILHFASAKLPLEGLGTSGLGASHGKAGFDAFTHQKSLLLQAPRFDLKLPYPPRPFPLGLVKRMMR